LPLTAVYDRVGYHSVTGPLVTCGGKVFLRVVKQFAVIVVHCNCILVSEIQLYLRVRE